jgi:tRNA pseudouridine55 synthase
MTSHDVVNVIRRRFQTRQVGHAGTLDPDATGLLVVGIGRGTKILTHLAMDDKVYEATLCLGIATDTLDASGSVVDSRPVTTITGYPAVLERFLGKYVQTPPMYSAIKVNGKKLYEYARAGIDVPDRPSRTIEIHSIEAMGEITQDDDRAFLSYRVHGSKGLYVRTLSYDIGQALGYPAHNHTLRRIRSGRFDVQDAHSLEGIEGNEQELLSLRDALGHLPLLEVDDATARLVQHGRLLPLDLFVTPELTRVVDSSGRLIALYDHHPTTGTMKPVNVFPKD